MSLNSIMGFTLEELAFLALSAIAVGSAVISITTKYSVYAAVALGMTGAGVAGLMALLGFGYVSAFHLLVYVGATVTFMVFSVIMVKERPGIISNLKPLALINAILLGGLFILVSYSAGEAGGCCTPRTVSLDELAVKLADKYWFPLLLVVVSLATIMIEGITIARGEEE